MIAAVADAVGAVVVQLEAVVEVAAADDAAPVAAVMIAHPAKIIRPKKAAIAQKRALKMTITANAKMARVTRTKMSHRKWTIPRKAKALPKPRLTNRTKLKLSTKNAPTPTANVPVIVSATTRAKIVHENATEVAVTVADATEATTVAAAETVTVAIVVAEAVTATATFTGFYAAKSIAFVTALNRSCATSIGSWPPFRKLSANGN